MLIYHPQSANILATAYEGYYARLRQAEIDENQRKIDEAAAIERVKVQRREECAKVCS